MSTVDDAAAGAEPVESREQRERGSRSLQDWLYVDTSVIWRPIGLID